LEKNLVYYGESTLLKQIKYFPLIQLFIVSLFIILLIVAMNIRNKSTQNQVWVGMAKETAHQLGTPISSLQGWVEMLKENEANHAVAAEMSKDVNRLQLVSERFGKIGSQPQLSQANVVNQVEQMVQYIKRRSSERVQFTVQAPSLEQVIAPINASLFDWVIENILKNALDAMEGNGQITIAITSESNRAVIDITDTGKGINRKHLSKVFRPGFTTKKRGWGLGLSLSKRIIETYHKGQLFIANTEPGKGTTFRIVLKKKASA
jgi:signal transduction histidine kinase